MIDSGLVRRVPREQQMLKGHLPRVLYWYTKTSADMFPAHLAADSKVRGSAGGERAAMLVSSITGDGMETIT